MEEKWHFTSHTVKISNLQKYQNKSRGRGKEGWKQSFSRKGLSPGWYTLWFLLCTEPSYWAPGKGASEMGKRSFKMSNMWQKEDGFDKGKKRKFYLKFVSFYNISRLYVWLLEKKEKIYIYIVLETTAKVSPYYIFLIELYKDYKELQRNISNVTLYFRNKNITFCYLLVIFLSICTCIYVFPQTAIIQYILFSTFLAA